MDYAGNPSLARETKERIVTTYHQTLDLAHQGRVQEAALGCDFILKMDPMFSPARQLQDRLHGAPGAVDLTDLPAVPRPGEGNGSSRQAMPAVRAQTEEADTGAFELDIHGGNDLPVVVVPEASLADGEGFGSDTPPVAMPTVRMEQPAFARPSGRAAASTAPSTPAPSGGDRIAQLLDEGQIQFDNGEYQAAIDAWSRIFLIDIDHREAASRIEQARTLKAELERQVDQIFHEGIAHRDAGRIEDARASFLAVLERHPHHLSAREALERLDRSGHATPEEELPEYDATLPPEDDRVADELAMFPGGDTFSPSALSAPPKRKRSFAVIGTFVFALLAAGGWLLWENRERLFPNAAAEPDVEAPPREDPIQQAEGMHKLGQTQRAIDELSQIPRDDPNHDRAQLLIGQWRASLEKHVEAAPAAGATDADAERQALLERARGAYGEREYLLAAKAFRAAERIAPLDGAAVDLFQDSKRQLLPIAQQIDLFREGEWEMLVPTLWRGLDQDPSNRDVRRLLADSYYNLGIRDLQHGKPDTAAESFAEVATLFPEDLMTQRLYLFSKGYESRNRDALYKIFVKLLELRR